MSIRTKLLLAFVVMILISAALGGFSFFTNGNRARDSKQIALSVEKQRLDREMDDSIGEIYEKAVELEGIVETGEGGFIKREVVSPQALEKIKSDFEPLFDRFQKSLDLSKERTKRGIELASNDPDPEVMAGVIRDRAMLEQIESEFGRFHTHFETFLGLLGSDLTKADDMFHQIIGPFYKDFISVHTAKNEVNQEAAIEHETIETGEETLEANRIVLAVSFASVVVGLALAWWIYKSICDPIQALEKASELV